MQTIKEVKINALWRNVMVQTKKGNPVHYMPYTYLMNEDLDTWTQSHNGGRCYGAMTTNMS